MSKREALFIIFLLILSLSVFCLGSSSSLKSDKKGNKVKIGEEFSLKINESAEIKDEALRITFKDVLVDSRCPVNVRCFWSGIAKITVIAKKGDKTSELELTLYHENERDFDDYKIKFVELKPERVAGKEIGKEEYEAFFVVLKARLL